MRWIRSAAWVALLQGLLAGGVHAQAGIYSCVDAKGRRLTADRPIPECLDRSQKEYNASGTVRRTIGPSLTGPERAAEQAREKQAAEERERVAEERRRDRALLIRYPSEAAHNKERADAVAHIDVATATAQKRLTQLAAQEKSFHTELEFHAGDPTRVPPALQRRIDQNRQEQQAQQRFIETKANEKARIQARFDEEREKLAPLWPQAKPAAAGASAPAR